MNKTLLSNKEIFTHPLAIAEVGAPSLPVHLLSVVLNEPVPLRAVIIWSDSLYQSFTERPRVPGHFWLGRRVRLGIFLWRRGLSRQRRSGDVDAERDVGRRSRQGGFIGDLVAIRFSSEQFSANLLCSRHDRQRSTCKRRRRGCGGCLRERERRLMRERQENASSSTRNLEKEKFWPFSPAPNHSASTALTASRPLSSSFDGSTSALLFSVGVAANVHFSHALSRLPSAQSTLGYTALCGVLGSCSLVQVVPRSNCQSVPRRLCRIYIYYHEY